MAALLLASPPQRQSPSAPPPTSAPIVKRCECGRKYTLEAWRALRRVGLQNIFDDDELCLELRNCVCGSTIALPMRLIPAPDAEVQP